MIMLSGPGVAVGPAGFSLERAAGETMPLFDAHRAVSSFLNTDRMRPDQVQAIEKAADILAFPSDVTFLDPDNEYIRTMSTLVPDNIKESDEERLESIRLTATRITALMGKLLAQEAQSSVELMETEAFLSRAALVSSIGHSFGKVKSVKDSIEPRID